MKNIDKHIEELLYHYNCVIIPEFGGFITSDEPARIDKKSNIIYPPSKRILFNKNLLNNDGLLANKIAKDENVSYQEASNYLIEYKDSCFLSLDKNGRVEVEKVGVLFFDKEKNLQFQQNKNNFLTKSFGLPTKFLMPLVKENVVINPVVPPVISRIETEVKVNRESVKVVKPTEKRTVKKRTKVLILPILLAPILLGGVFMANQYGYVGETKLELSSFNPFNTKKTILYTPRVTKEIIFVADEVENNNPTTEVATEAVIEIEKVEKTASLPYHVIGGCFSEIENANTLISEWASKGYSPQVVGKSNGLFRVSVQGFGTREEAQQFQEEIKNSAGLSSWILKK